MLDILTVTLPESAPTVNPVSEPTPIADTLFKAADIMEKGWIPYYRWDTMLNNEPITTGTRFCAIGAIARAMDKNGHGWDEEERAVSDFLIDTLNLNPQPWYSVRQKSISDLANWNNSADQQTVVSGFRRAAMVAEVLGK